MPCDRQQSRSKGFTLIELVVAITILSVLTAIVFSGLRSGLRAWSRGNSELDEIRTTDATVSLLRAQIQGALPMIFGNGLDPQPQLSFIGDEYRLRFVSRSSFRDGPDAPARWVELRWQTDGISGRLTGKESPVLAPTNEPGTQPLWEGVLLEGRVLRFEYLPRRMPNETSEWVKEWPESNLLMPAAVRMTYERRGQRYQLVLPLQYAENSWSRQWFR